MKPRYPDLLHWQYPLWDMPCVVCKKKPIPFRGGKHEMLCIRCIVDRETPVDTAMRQTDSDS